MLCLNFIHKILNKNASLQAYIRSLIRITMNFLNFFSKKVPLFVSLITALVAGISVYFIVQNNSEKAEQEFIYNQLSKSSSSCNNKPVRLKNYNFVQPLLFVDQACESDNYADLKAEIVAKISQFSEQGNLINASVYFRNLETTEWIAVNEQESYEPGSLLKVPELITFLKMEENKPGTLKTVYENIKEPVVDKNPVFLSKSIISGKSYTVSELLRYMITYSDNAATLLLNRHMDLNTFMNIFSDLGLPRPDMTASTYKMNVVDYSKFFRILYNASYISKEHSEYAAELLSTCDFKEGFEKGLPPATKLIHKFGEGGDGHIVQLSESGIFYLNNQHFLLTVMTKGQDMKRLPEVLSQISNIVYNHVSK